MSQSSIEELEDMPGMGILLLAMYDFNYTDSDGFDWAMREGEEYELLDTSNADWWRVRRLTDDPENFFVPSQYVQIKGKIPPKVARKTSNGPRSVSRDRSPSPDYASPLQKTSNGSVAHDRDSPAEYVNLEDYRHVSKITVRPEEEVAYENLSVIQAAIKPPRNIDGSYMEKKLGDNWSLYTDHNSSRQFYYNSETKETSWKPPRLERKPSSHSVGSHNNNPDNSSMDDPQGWIRDITSSGEVFFTHPVTEEKWQKLMDEYDKMYYFKESSKTTLRELPEVEDESCDVFPNPVPAETKHVRRKEFRSSKAKSVSYEIERTLLNPPESQKRSSTLPVSLNTSDPVSNVAAPKPYGVKCYAPAHCPVLTANSIFYESRSTTSSSPRDRSPPQEATPTQHAINTNLSMNAKEGVINKTKLQEGYKKLKKSWSPSFVVLNGSNLVFYKDQKAVQAKPGSPNGKPEFVVNLQGATSIYNPRDVTSKKNCLQLTTPGGNQYLLQVDDFVKIQEWNIQIQMVINELGPVGNEPEDTKQSRPVQKVIRSGLPNTMNRSLSLEDTKPIRAERSAPPRPTVSVPPPPTPTSRQEGLRRIRERLRSLMSRRPTIESLQEKGIIKEMVFGSHLRDLCDREHSTIPQFVKRCIAAIETKGLDFDGMYRVPGNFSSIQKLRFVIDKNEEYELDDAEWDTYILTGALKLFFRELKEPMIPFKYYSSFVDALAIQSCKSRVHAFRDLFAVLPKCNYDTLKILFHHLRKVIDNHLETRMHAPNVATMFGPTLMWPEKETNIAVSMMQQNTVVEFMLLEYKGIFL